MRGSLRCPIIPETEPAAGPGAAGALRCAEAVRGERRETTYYASARLDGLLRRVEHVSSPGQLGRAHSTSCSNQ